MELSEEEYEEYQQLREWAKKQKVYQSLESITELKDDIDLPIRKCVAMVALLGCEPTFSCCGFDYAGQPFHKSHQYRQPYIKMKSNWFSTRFYMNANVILSKFGWNFRPMGQEYILELLVSMNPHWMKTECIHSSEECVIGIANLEWALKSFSSEFAEEVTIRDTNESHRERLKFWQYPPKKEWVVRRDKLEDL